jgi:hypothetical protein
MPLYQEGKAVLVFGGDTFKMFDAESPANNEESVAVALQPNVDHYEVRMSFASEPSACQYDVQTAVENEDAKFLLADSLTDPLGEVMRRQLVTDKLVRIKKISQTGGGAVTISITPKRKT